MWIDLHQLEKVHGSPNTQKGRPTTASTQHYEAQLSRINVSIVAVHSQIVPQRRITSSIFRPHDLVPGGVTQPISYNLCVREIGDLQTCHAHVRLTHLPFPAPTIRASRHAQPARLSRRYKQHPKDGSISRGTAAWSQRSSKTEGSSDKRTKRDG